MAETPWPKIDKIGTALNLGLASIYFSTGIISEFVLQADLVSKVEAAKATKGSIDLAIQNSNFGRTIQIFGQNTAEILTNQGSDLALIPFYMSLSRAMLGIMGIDYDSDAKIIDFIDGVALSMSLLLMSSEIYDLNSSCADLTAGCVGDYRDLLVFSVPVIALMIYRQKGMLLTLGHIFKSLKGVPLQS